MNCYKWVAKKIYLKDANRFNFVQSIQRGYTEHKISAQVCIYAACHHGIQEGCKGESVMVCFIEGSQNK